MPKLKETSAEKFERLERRFGWHVCSFCKEKYIAFDAKTSKFIYKSHYLRPLFKITIGPKVLNLSDICHDCVNSLTEEISRTIIKLRSE